MLVLIDNFDSFTYNLAHFFGELGQEVTVIRNNEETAEKVFARKPSHIVISPGPCGPSEAGHSIEIIKMALTHSVPLLGVCLGHQCIGFSLGGQVKRAPTPMHGKVDRIFHKGSTLYQGLPSPFLATRYHSLIVTKESLPAELSITSESESGLIMGLAHNSRPIFGVQFHPESIATQHGHALLRNFLLSSR